MKQKIMIAALSILFAMPSFAQYGRYGRSAYRRPVAPVGHYSMRPHNAGASYYGLRIGLGVSTVNSDDIYLDGGSAKSGLNLGLVAGFQASPASPVIIETGLNYAEKGGKGNYGGHSFSYNLNYLEVPLVMKYQIGIDRLASVQPFAGVYGAVGVSGKIKDFGQRQAYSSFDDKGFSRWDGGVRLGCGLQYDHLYAEMGYDVGLANISHDYFDTSHTGSFFLNVGLNF